MTNSDKIRAQKREWARKNYLQNPEKCKERSRAWTAVNREKRQDAHLRKTFGVSLEWYRETLEKQGGCAICDTQEPGGRDHRFHVDHDHKTGKVRGLLCNKCNLMVGLSKDDPDILRKAAAYLEK